MNASRASGLVGIARPGFLALALALSVPLLLPLPAPAQEAPISLFPPTAPAPESGPEAAPQTEPAAPRAEPAAPVDAPPQAESTLGETPRYDEIRIDRLQELDIESLGILEEESGGLGLDAWAGSDRKVVDRLIAALPAEPTSPVLQALTTRLLLTNARAPRPAAATAAIPSDAGGASQESGFLRQRAERLYAMGDLAGLNRLLSVVPQRVEDPWLARARVDGLLLAGNDQEACRVVGGAVARFLDDPYWSRAQVLCQFIAEQRDQAFLALDLLREQDPDGDPTFYALTNLFIGGEAEGLDPASLTPLTMTMLRVADGAPPEGLAEVVAPLLLHGIAGLSRASALDKAAARERLVQATILPGEDLAEAINAIDFADSELADPLAEADKAGGFRARALLFHAASREAIATAKAEFLLAALTAADAAGRGYAMAQAVRPLFVVLSPGLELAWFAPTAARSLYRIGQFERAAAWSSVLRLDGVRNPGSQAAFEALKPIARLAGSAAALSISEEPSGDGGNAAARRLLLAMVLSRALDQSEPNPWPGVADKAAAEGPALRHLPTLLALADAAAAGRRGETVLLAALALGDVTLHEAHPLALGYAVSALNAVGLGADARALALEAAAGAGL